MSREDRQLSASARLLLQDLTEQERQILNKSYPFKAERNELIRQMFMRGATVKVMAEITGLCEHTLSIYRSKMPGTPRLEQRNLILRNRHNEKLMKAFIGAANWFLKAAQRIELERESDEDNS
jgi:FixJ family two-component response regulator